MASYIAISWGRASNHARRWYAHVALAFLFSTIIDRCWPSLSSIAEVADIERQVCQNLQQNLSVRLVDDKFMEICAIMPFTRQFGYKRGNLSRLNSVGWLPKTIFALRRANLPHNLGLSHDTVTLGFLFCPPVFWREAEPVKKTMPVKIS
jgi:hypothetical protein